MVKKIAYFFGILLLIGIIGQFFGLVEESSPTKFTEQQIAEREKLIAFWIDFQKKSNGLARLELQDDTLVISPLKDKTPFHTLETNWEKFPDQELKKKCF